MGYIFWTVSGADEVKAWTILKGTKAPAAAGRIHTDFEKGFIMAEVTLDKPVCGEKESEGDGKEIYRKAV